MYIPFEHMSSGQRLPTVAFSTHVIRIASFRVLHVGFAEQHNFILTNTIRIGTLLFAAI